MDLSRHDAKNQHHGLEQFAQSVAKDPESSLVNTLPKTKKGKYTAVTEAHKV